jgi:hypothetical protein
MQFCCDRSVFDLSSVFILIILIVSLRKYEFPWDCQGDFFLLPSFTIRQVDWNKTSVMHMANLVTDLIIITSNLKEITH